MSRLVRIQPKMILRKKSLVLHVWNGHHIIKNTTWLPRGFNHLGGFLQCHEWALQPSKIYSVPFLCLVPGKSPVPVPDDEYRRIWEGSTKKKVYQLPALGHIVVTQVSESSLNLWQCSRMECVLEFLLSTHSICKNHGVLVTIRSPGGTQSKY